MSFDVARLRTALCKQPSDNDTDISSQCFCRNGCTPLHKQADQVIWLCGAAAALSSESDVHQHVQASIRLVQAATLETWPQQQVLEDLADGTARAQGCNVRLASMYTESFRAEGAELVLVHATLLSRLELKPHGVHARDPGHTSSDQVRQVARLEGSSVCKGHASALSALGCSLGHGSGLPEQPPMQHQCVACKAQALRSPTACGVNSGW